MINKEHIQSIWNSLTHSGQGEFEYQLISRETIPFLNIGYNNLNQRCLILELPQIFNKSFNEIEKENLSLKFFPGEKCLCIILNDDYFKDLFDDLILSVYCKIYQVSNPEEYSGMFIKHFTKWSAFFENKKYGILSPQAIKGLFGELTYLKELLISANIGVNDILQSWRGPYDNVHDFMSDFKDTEIKTISNTENYVKISSEFQLECPQGKELFLSVITVSCDQTGKNIKDLINEIRDMNYNNGGDCSIFLKALLQKGITLSNMDEYDQLRFITVSLISYDCNKVNFPKFTSEEIPEEICKVTYHLQLNLMDNFITFKKEFGYGY